MNVKNVVFATHETKDAIMVRIANKFVTVKKSFYIYLLSHLSNAILSFAARSKHLFPDNFYDDKTKVGQYRDHEDTTEN